MTNPSAWGVSDGFFDVHGEWHAADPDAIWSAMHAMGAAGEQPPAPTMVTVRLDHQLPPIGHGQLVFEDGTEVRVDGDAPPDLTSGYHLFYPDTGEPYPLVVSPGRVPRPERPMWGFSTQLYAARSRQSWGIGDLSDLRRLAQWSTSAGADLVVVNPLHACAPTLPQQPSPYYPGSRCFSNPIYLSVEDLPGAAWLDRGQLDGLARAGQALNSQRLIDRDEVWTLKSRALEALFADFRGSTAFNIFRSEQGRPLELFAAYCALAERHGSDWRTWAPGFLTPDGVAVERFAKSRAGAPRVTYYCWLQWLLSEQLGAAVVGTGLVQDLAVGIDPSGADSWIWQNTIAGDMRVGAPPDAFNTLGQDWGLPPFDPWKLRSAGYAPWIEALRSGFRCARGLRIDHVMGLFRLYWIPPGQSPARGVYVRYPHHDLLNILALEAERAGAFVVGEDLGTVEDHVRDDLAERAILSCRVWWFEDKPPAEWPIDALGSVSTHDLPTVAGVVTGSDLEAQRRIGIAPDEAMSVGLHRRIEERTGAEGSAPVTEVIALVHADLAEAPCLLLTASLDDVLGLEERPNMPGTIDQWPNWRLALPVPVEDLPSVPLAKEIAAILSRT